MSICKHFLELPKRYSTLRIHLIEYTGPASTHGITTSYYSSGSFYHAGANFAVSSYHSLICLILTHARRVSGFLGPLLAPSFFASSQTAYEAPHNLYLSEHILALQLGNCYLLLALLGLFILNTTTEIKTVRAYLAALWIADIGHVGVTAWAMGTKDFMDVAGWNALAWGNIGATVFLFAMRSLYFLGTFGPNQEKSNAQRVKEMEALLDQMKAGGKTKEL